MSLFILIYFNFYSCRDVTRMRHNVPEIYERYLLSGVYQLFI